MRWCKKMSCFFFFGTISEAFSDDLRFLLYAIAGVVSKLDIYAELDCLRPCMSKQPCYN